MEFEEFKTKVINKSLTIGDAFDHILAKKLGESKRNEISSVYKGLIGEDIDLNQPYFDTYSKEPFVKALSVDSKSGKHRLKERYRNCRFWISGYTNKSKRAYERSYIL